MFPKSALLRAHSISAVFALSVAALSQLPKSAKELHEYHLVDVRWDISFDFAAGSIVGDVVDTVTLNKDNATIVFDCANLNVVYVDTDTGITVKTESDKNVLVIKTLEPTHKGEKIAFHIHYTGKPEAGIYFVPAARAFPAHTDIVYTQGEMEDNRYWLPTYDDPDDKATSEGTIHVPAGWKALSNGRLVEVRHEGTADVWHWKMDRPHSTYLISMVAGPYDEVPDGLKPVPVSFWVPEGLDKWGAQAFGGTDKIVQFYGKLTGVPFPWAKYSQSAVADFMFGGMENVTCTTQTIGALHPESVAGNVDSTGLVAHELAHQWFGDLVTTVDWSHIWLNEGWASFLPLFWDREKYGLERFDLDRLNVFQGALAAHKFAPERSMIWTKYELPIDMFDGFAYPGGASRMCMLMHQVGESRFWPAIKTYLNQFKFKNATTEDFFASMSKSLGVDLDEFRKQWFYTPAAPSLTVKRNGDSVVIQQGATPFHVPLDLWLIERTGQIEKRHIDLQAVHSTEIQNPGGRLVMLDPNVWLMADISYDMGYSNSDWKLLYEKAPNSAEKERLGEMFFAALPETEKVAMSRAEHSEPLLEQQINFIKDRPFLLEMTHHSDPRIVLAAIRALAVTPKSDDTVARLKEFWPGSPNDLLKDAALETLLALTQDGSLADEGYKTDSYDEGIRQTALRWWTDHQPDKAREVALEALKGGVSEPVKLQAIRTLGHVKDKQGEHRVYDALVGFLSERSNSPLRAAIGALAEYGNKNAIPLIEARANHGLHFVRRDVQDALQRLRS